MTKTDWFSPDLPLSNYCMRCPSKDIVSTFYLDQLRYVWINFKTSSDDGDIYCQVFDVMAVDEEEPQTYYEGAGYKASFEFVGQVHKLYYFDKC